MAGRRELKRLASGFTLVELVTTIGVIAVLSILSMAAFSQMRSVAQGAHCANSLRQLGVATRLYLDDHNQIYFPVSINTAAGMLWYFGLQQPSSSSLPEGQRLLDSTAAPLYPYLQQVGGVEICPAFPYDSSLWKPKYSQKSYGYGYNKYLGTGDCNALTIKSPSEIVVFGDCAQVNDFQAPASPSHPMIEEFYFIEEKDPIIHFRHGGVAQFVFADGHVAGMTPYPGTLDTRLPQFKIGRITPAGSMQYLQ